jgi:predicted lipid-binding transport protein (Tim44 family)
MTIKRAGMKRTGLILSLLLAATVALAPALAEARGGGGSSSGSRGSRTYSAPPPTQTAPQAQPMQRSMTQPTQTQRPAQAAPNTAAAQPSFFQRNPFMAGMMGGLLGAGIGAMLFGGGFENFFGEGFAGMLGMLVQFALIGGLIYLAVAFFRRRLGSQPQMTRPAYAYAGAAPDEDRGDVVARRALPDAAPLDLNTGKVGAIPASGGSPSAAAHDEIGVTEADYGAFETLLIEIQKAWSSADLGALRAHLTPEMLSYFSEQLSADASAGTENRVEDVRFENGDLAEAWSEGETQYATVAMTWTARDYTLRSGTDHVIVGSRTERVPATEVWTFMRVRGGRWLLAAIQQV